MGLLRDRAFIKPVTGVETRRFRHPKNPDEFYDGVLEYSYTSELERDVWLLIKWHDRPLRIGYRPYRSAPDELVCPKNWVLV